MDNALDFQCLSKLVLDFLIFGDSIASWSSIWFLFRVMNNALDFIPQIHLYIFSFFEINIDLRLKDSSLLEIFLSYSFQQVKGFFFMTNLSTFSLWSFASLWLYPHFTSYIPFPIFKIPTNSFLFQIIHKFQLFSHLNQDFIYIYISHRRIPIFLLTWFLIE